MGAALLATTVDPFSPQLVRLLVALQLVWDYVDTLAEQPARRPDRDRRAAASRARRRDRGGAAARRLPPARPTPAATCCARRAPVARRRRGLPGVRARAAARRERAAAARDPVRDQPRAAGAARGGPARVGRAACRTSRRRALVRAGGGRQLVARGAGTARARPPTRPPTTWRPSGCTRPTSPGSRRSARCSTASPTARADARAGLASWVDHYPSDDAAAERLAEVATRARRRRARCCPTASRHVAIVCGHDRDASVASRRRGHPTHSRSRAPCCAPPTRARCRCCSCCCAAGAASAASAPTPARASAATAARRRRSGS